LLCAAAVATAQSYVAPPSYGKNATEADWRQPALAGNTLAAPALCLSAVQVAEYRHGIPRGLLLAIAEVETGRPLTDGGGRVPWPWSANADNPSYYFATRQDAVAWTVQALRHGTASTSGARNDAIGGAALRFQGSCASQ
jgi:hypothetical protein